MATYLSLAYSWGKSSLARYCRQLTIAPAKSSLSHDGNSLAGLFAGLDGHKITIPDLESLSPTWTMNLNPHLESVHEDLNSWVKSYVCVFYYRSWERQISKFWMSSWFKEDRIRNKIAALDADRLVAMMYPRTGREELLNLSKLIAWNFPWDDAIDDAALMQQPTDIIRYRDQTIEVIKEGVTSTLDKPSKIHADPAIQSFWEIGAAIREKGTTESNARFAFQQCLWIESCAESQIVRKASKPVTVAEYLWRREDNIGVYPLFELIFYAYRIQIPAKWRWENNANMRELWRETAWQITMLNDLLSLRRELVHGQFESLIPLLMYHESLMPQAAVDRTSEMIHASYQRFYRIEMELYAEVDPENIDVVKTYVHAFKDLVMCNLHWSYGLKRYMDPQMLMNDGTVVFEIRTPG